MTINKPSADPKTGLPPYQVRSGMTATKLNARAAAAAKAREELQKQLDKLTDAFTEAFAEADRAAATRQRLAATARAHRNSTRR